MEISSALLSRNTVSYPPEGSQSGFPSALARIIPGLIVGQPAQILGRNGVEYIFGCLAQRQAKARMGPGGQVRTRFLLGVRDVRIRKVKRLPECSLRRISSRMEN